jgi:hypothetical protein
METLETVPFSHKAAPLSSNLIDIKESVKAYENLKWDGEFQREKGSKAKKKVAYIFCIQSVWKHIVTF